MKAANTGGLMVANEQQTALGMAPLYGANTPARFWRGQAGAADRPWQHAAAAAADKLLPEASHVLGDHGWDGLMAHVLGEGQFGPSHFRLGGRAQLYYRLRPFLPRRMIAAVRRYYQSKQQSVFPLGWPIEDRYVRFLFQMREYALLGAKDAFTGTAHVEPKPDHAPMGLWPDDAGCAFVLTHDVEKAAGQAFVRTLADMDARYGFRSSFNFVAEDYQVDTSLLSELRDRGFEVGSHGLKHDGSLFASRAGFAKAATEINRCLRAWDATGFRSPSTHRDPVWMQELDIEYDLSFFDTDPFETMPGGTMSIWPFFCGRFVELPYTLLQDHTLLVVLRQRTPALWLDKVAFIRRWGGMVLVNVHPDYMRDPAHLAVYEEFLQHMAELMRGRRGIGSGESAPTAPACWHALPRDVARWWRQRAGMPAWTRTELAA